MKYALIIGNNQYDDQKLAQLKTPAADSQALATILGNPAIGSFDQVTPLINQTETQVRRAISAFLAQKKPDDLVLMYFSGHGILDDRGRLYLALKDTQVDLLKATSIPSAFLADEMDSCRSKRQILILDCCHSGAFARGTKGDQKAITESTFEGSGFGRVVLTASDSTQYALEGDQVVKQTELSLFTHFLLEGLGTGEADANNDGHVSLDEWYDYTYARVISETPRQVPHKWSYNQQGDLIIARNPYRKKRVAELPYELVQALESSFVGIRESAVNELGKYLRSSDPEMADLAISYLQKMKQDDSRRISSLAERLLSESEARRVPAIIASSPVPVETKNAGSDVPVPPPSKTLSAAPEAAPGASVSSPSISISRVDGNVAFWTKWIVTVILAAVLSWGFYEYNKSVSGNGSALPVVLFTVVAGLVSAIQWAAFKEGLRRWVGINLAAGLALGLLHNLLYWISEEWWDLHLGILLTVWVTGNFVVGAILSGNAQGRSKSLALPPLGERAAVTKETAARPRFFFTSLSVLLLLLFLGVFTRTFGLIGAADLFTILFGATGILIGIPFFLTRGIRRNFGYITLVGALFLVGVMVAINLFNSDFNTSYFAFPVLLALASGIFFATQQESRQDFRFWLLAGFLIALGIAQIARDISEVGDVFSKIAAVLALAAAFAFFRSK